MVIPEKLYIEKRKPRYSYLTACTNKNQDDDIEYVRAESFVEKAWDWIEDFLLSSNQQDKSEFYRKHFEKAMKL